jgi:hypothetical protein
MTGQERRTLLGTLAMLALAAGPAGAGAEMAAVTYHPTGLAIQPAGAGRVTLTVVGPGGLVVTDGVAIETGVFLGIADGARQALPDGQYTYELRGAPAVEAGIQEAVRAAREAGDDGAVQAALARAGLRQWRPWVRAGTFRIVDGALVMPGQPEPRP